MSLSEYSPNAFFLYKIFIGIDHVFISVTLGTQAGSILTLIIIIIIIMIYFN